MVELPRRTKAIPIGSVIGDWTVLEYAGVKGSGGNSFWKCRCKCGAEHDIVGSSLRRGKTSRCYRCSGRINGRLGLNCLAKKHLYIVQCGEYIKIGSSDDPERRIKNLQTYCPYPIVTLAILEDRGHEEPEWHERYKHAHHQGEWYVGGACDVTW